MGRTSQLLILAAFVCVARLAGAAGCGNGILEAGEQCDPASPAGEAACPGACISLPTLDACQCAEVSNDPRDFAAIATVQVRIGSNSFVLNGGAAVTAAGGLLAVGPGSAIADGSQAIGDRCKLLPTSSVGRLFCNEDLVLGTAFIGSGGPFAFTPPVTFPSLPPFIGGVGGGPDVFVTNGGTEYLAPGSYGNLIVDDGGKLFLHGLGAAGVGRYDALGIKVIGGGQLLTDNPVVINLERSLQLTGDAILSPNFLTGIQPGDLRVNIEGRGAKLGKGAFAQAHIRAPNGKITVGRGTIAVGQLIGQKVVIKKNAVLQYTGGCGDGVKQPTEACDTTAANGDQACPGNCIPSGQAGQCSCRCTSNAQCNDQNACNGVETCTQGHCALGTPLDCNDNNSCTLDCNPATGCIQVPVQDGVLCDDGNECTKSDRCLAGECQPGEPRLCNDGNACTADSCDPEHGCEHTAVENGNGCSDGDACTGADLCNHGVCVPGAVVDCNDLNPCTADTCDELTGCVHTVVTNGVSCAGPSPCTALDACKDGACVSGVSQLCGDSNACTTESCTVVGPIGSQTAQCTSTPVVDCNDLNPCTIDTCDPQTGCKHVAAPNGSSCSGPSPCTVADVCNAGVCKSGVDQLCNDSNACTVETCTVTGPIGNQVASCHSTPAVDCNDLNPCTIDSCDTQLGCKHVAQANGFSCAGPSPCTALDVCSAGVCTSGVAQLCSDSNPCTTESCTVMGPVGAQSAHCNYTPVANQTPCGPSGQVCTNSVCQ